MMGDSLDWLLGCEALACRTQKCWRLSGIVETLCDILTSMTEHGMKFEQLGDSQSLFESS